MYLQLHDISLYYKTTGVGRPIILLHGNGEDHEIFDVLTLQLAQSYTVYAIDSRGHGKSTKVESIIYEDLAKDIVAFIEALKLEAPVLYGFSDGGIIGILIAMKHPHLLSKLIISGANLNPRGLKSWFLTVYRFLYLITKDAKIHMMLTQPDISFAAIESIRIPVLVLAGDRDLIKERHTKEIAEHIRESKLRILRRESHTSYVIRSDKLFPLIQEFVDCN